MNLPKNINVTRAVSYSIDDEMLSDIQEAWNISKEEITTKDVLRWLTDWVDEDFNCSEWLELTATDENNKVIDTGIVYEEASR